MHFSVRAEQWPTTSKTTACSILRLPARMSASPCSIFHNNGDGTFSDRTAQAGLSDQLGGLNIVAGDYNNDGCIDLLVLRGGWEFGMRKSLLRNNCNGT